MDENNSNNLCISKLSIPFHMCDFQLIISTRTQLLTPNFLHIFQSHQQDSSCYRKLFILIPSSLKKEKELLPPGLSISRACALEKCINMSPHHFVNLPILAGSISMYSCFHRRLVGSPSARRSFPESPEFHGWP